MNSYKQTKQYLDSFINYEHKPFFPYKRSFKLQRVKNLFKALNIPYHKLKVIHIAGTKGKGSTAIFCANFLAQAGLKVGLYTSPHLFDFRERIKIIKGAKSYLIPKNYMVKTINDIKLELAKLKLSKKLGEISFFEIYTAIAFKYFIERKVDFAVLETGLGGRLDATNVVKPFISIITHISYDHTDKLGNHLRDIAYEKAGIIKKNTPVISARQRPQALDEIKKHCKNKKANFYILGKDFSAKNVRINKDYTAFDFIFNEFKAKGLKIYLKGKHQIENAACSLATLSLLKENNFIKQEIDFKKALKDIDLEGRFEVAKKDPLVVMDIAHNPSSFSVLAENLKIYFPGKKIILIFAASKDKDVNKMLKEINFSQIIITRFSNPRAFSPREIKEKCKLRKSFIAKDIKQALQLAKEVYKRDSLILISGSLFLVSEAKQAIKRL